MFRHSCWQSRVAFCSLVPKGNLDRYRAFSRRGVINFMGILLALAILTALCGSYCATKSASNAKDSRAEGRDRSVSPYLHFVERKQLAELYKSEPNHVMFRLQGPQLAKERGEQSPQHLGITLQELEKCIPWVPGNSTVFICSPDGFSPSLLNQLRGLHTQRELFLVESLPNDLRSIRMMEARVL